MRTFSKIAANTVLRLFALGMFALDYWFFSHVLHANPMWAAGAAVVGAVPGAVLARQEVERIDDV